MIVRHFLLKYRDDSTSDNASLELFPKPISDGQRIAEQGSCYSEPIDGIDISPFEENEKRVIGDEIVNVTYHKIDWALCFKGGYDIRNR